nr:Ivy family c-type lysozyme inhibitor [Photobacterium damselae]
MVVSVKDIDGAITEPSKYATYWFIGNPDQSMKEALVKTLQQNPNWK